MAPARVGSARDNAQLGTPRRGRFGSPKFENAPESILARSAEPRAVVFGLYDDF